MTLSGHIQMGRYPYGGRERLKVAFAADAIVPHYCMSMFVDTKLAMCAGATKT